MITVKEAVKLLRIEQLDEHMENKIFINGNDFNPQNTLELAAYGDFLIEEIYVSSDGVNLIPKQEFVKATA